MTPLREGPASLASAIPAFFAIFTSTIVFTPKDAFLTRLSAVVALFTLNYPIWLLVADILPTMTMKAAYSVLLWCGCASAGEIVLISRASAEDLTESDDKDAGTVTLLYRAACLYFNMRRTGTKWEIKDLSYTNSQSRVKFLAYKSVTIGFAILFADAMTAAPPPEPHLVSKDKQSLWNLSQLTSEDVVFRLAAVIMMWIIGFACNYIILSTGGFVSVALGLSKPESWPRVHNGPFSSLTSIRGFWSIFWHQILRKTVSGWGDAISDDLFCLRRGTLVSRYTRLFLAFFVSGLLHHAMDVIWDVPHYEAVSIVFFSMQAFGIMAEDAVQAVTKSWGVPQRVRSVVGSVWLLVFLWWTTPRWFYGTIRNSAEAGGPFPFSFFK